LLTPMSRNKGIGGRVFVHRATVFEANNQC
jgi:hypothetical protein